MKDTRTLTEIVAENDELQTLKALQLKVAQTLDNTTSARDIAALVKQLRELTEKIKQLDECDDEIKEILREREKTGKIGRVR